MSEIQFTQRFSNVIDADLRNITIGGRAILPPHFNRRPLLSQSNISSIILHHTGGSTRDVVRLHDARVDLRNPTELRYDGIQYHFVIGPENGLGANNGTVPAEWVYQAYTGCPLNRNAWHAGRDGNVATGVPGNVNSIAITVSGQFDTQTQGVFAPTNLSDAQHNQVRQSLTNLIADCLISYPRIPRTNRAVQTMRPAPAEIQAGVMLHSDISIGRVCPGRGFPFSDIINDAIALANMYDAVERLIVQGITIPAPQNIGGGVHWARNGHQLEGRVGELIVAVSHRNFTQPFTRPDTLFWAVTRLNLHGLIPHHERSIWSVQGINVPHLEQLLIELATWFSPTLN